MPNPRPPVPDPAVVRVLKEYRAALDAKETGLMEQMAREWLEVERRLDADIAALAYRVKELQDQGKTITEQIVWREERYKYLHAQMDDEIARFNGRAATITATGQSENAMLGIQAANDAISASFGSVSAVGPYWNRLNINAIQSMIGFAGDGSPLKNLLKADYPDAVDGLMRELINGMARGLNPAETARAMARGMGMGLDRALLIARTETARAYRMGSTEQYRESGVVSGFYRLVKKETACIACLMLDGQPFDTREELSDHPRGKCIAVPQVMGVKKPRWELGRTFFRDLSTEEQRQRMGPEKYQLWTEGKFNLTDLPRMSHSDEWGDAPRVATIKELTG